MVLIENYPQDPKVSQYVDRYQLFVIPEPAYLKTVPNGKIEGYLIQKGEFLRWDDALNSFVASGASGYLPATNQTSLYHIPECLVCLNIKLNLNVLSLSLFDGFLTQWENFKIIDLIPGEAQGEIRNWLAVEKPALDVVALDRIMAGTLGHQALNQEIARVIQLIESGVTQELKVSDLAHRMNRSPKTFERWIYKHFRMTPKELCQVVRFDHTTLELKNSESRRLIDSLAFGYYDQSHFIKDCRKITGYSPKAFFSKLKLSTNDIILE